MTTITHSLIDGDLSLDSNIKNIARAISAFADSARADSSLLLSTALVSSDARISDSGEGYTGVIRFLSYTDPTGTDKPSEGTTTANQVDLKSTSLLSIAGKVSTYTKNIDVIGAQEASLQSLISKTDGLSYLGGKFGAVRARREENNLRAVLAGVGADVYSAAPTFTTGTAVDAGIIGNFGYHTAYEAVAASNAFSPLFTNVDTTNNRSSFFDVLLDAMTAVAGEFEEPFYYLVVDADTFNVIRKENVLDAAPVTDGNLNISTVLGGKIRLIVTGKSGVDAVRTGANHSTSSKVSYLMKAGSFHYSNVAMNNPTAIDTNPLANLGGGQVTIVNRWGNIIHPMGYSWTGTAGAFPSNTTLALATSWKVEATNVNETGIFPIFHG